jgi:hypothetical protein
MNAIELKKKYSDLEISKNSDLDQAKINQDEDRIKELSYELLFVEAIIEALNELD